MRDPPVIAVVDDDTAILELISELLADEGYQVLPCRTGREAQRLIRTHQPDGVIVDLQLADVVSGWDILELMRNDSVLQQIPVIVCSADMSFLQAQADRLSIYNCAVLEKPFELDRFVETVKQIFGQV